MNKLIKRIATVFAKKFPRQWIIFRYFIRFGKMPNLHTPSTLNEKILYLSLYTDTTQWTNLADKYLVREYVNYCGCNDTLVHLYGVYKNASEIDYSKLPNEFVIKTNHGCGGILFIKDKNIIETSAINEFLNRSISQRYGDLESGIHYTRIKPCIIIEQLLHETNPSTSLIDYKIWCFNGTPKFIFVITNRQNHMMDIMLYDLSWNALPQFCKFSKTYRPARLIDKPTNLNDMLEIASRLASGFPQVRVDLYNINGKVYFGELTFTSLGGLMNYFTNEFQMIAGNMIDLDFKPNQKFSLDRTSFEDIG